ncbi:MAG: putative bifunctional diguanylate cyclase/phosphodiesterase, partial [Chloroflexus sp.]
IQMQVINRSWVIVLRTNRDPADGWLLLCRQSDTPLALEEQQLVDHIEQLTTIALEQHVTLHKLAYQAHHDALTGLPNRLLFEDRLQHAIEHARRNNTLVAVLFIDLDRFKQVNDTLGHAIGDLLLIQVARRFELCVRATDTLARHGGDEFLLVLPEINSPQQVTAIARRLHEALEQPFVINGHEIFVSVSIGASLYPIDGTDVMTLQRAADMAMYRAKGTLRNSFQFFDATITSSSLEQLQIETLLRRAIERNELLLHYQPKVDRAGKLVGFEALIRWQNVELGMVSPARFIPIAEDTGLIISIGAWVLHEIARQMGEWRAQGLPIVPVAANVSALQFSQSGFVQTVAETLVQADLPVGWLELELTESMLMGQIDNLRRQLIELRQLGVTLAIDDFGTGYSSLSYLHRLPINVLKIDRSFVARIDQSDAMVERSLVSTIISLGHHLGMQIVAEGVETVGQRQILFDAGCDLFQGYSIGRPLPAEAAASWLRARAEANES